MGKSNAIVVFSRLTQLDRSSRDDFYSVMPWTDVDALYSTMFEDVTDAALRFGHADVHVFRSAKDHSDDFLGEFMKGVVVHDLAGDTLTAQAAFALEQLAPLRYAHVAVVLENNPSMDEHLFKTAFHQLSHEDDCAVIGLTEEEKCYLIGLRQPDFDLFERMQGDVLTEPTGLLKTVCTRDVVVIPLEPKYSLDLAVNLGRLKSDLETASAQQPPPGRRALQMFRNLDRKYRRRNGR